MDVMICSRERRRICLQFSVPAFILLWCVGQLGAASEPPDSGRAAALKELKRTVFNFDEVAPDVYRSGLLNEESAALLKELGVKTVINFHDDPVLARKESDFLKVFGIYMVWVPWEGLNHPRDEDIDQFLKLMDTPELRPVLIHCKRGAERTGVAIGCWRVSHEGWTTGRAYQEMEAHKFRSFRYGHLKRYLYQFAEKHGEQGMKTERFFERAKTDTLYSLYQLRKLSPFYRPAARRVTDEK